MINIKSQIKNKGEELIASFENGCVVVKVQNPLTRRVTHNIYKLNGSKLETIASNIVDRREAEGFAQTYLFVGI